MLCYGEIRPQDLIPPIASMLAENLPFRFLLFSRPEPRIHEALKAASFGPHMQRLGLGDSWDARRDIQTFLHDEFSSIHESRSTVVFPKVWPAPEIINKLVDRACGQFIYAATVLKFVDDEYSQPTKQLLIVLGLSHTVKGNSPFKDLDELYRQILSLNPNQCEVVWVLCTLLRLQLLKCHRLPPNPKSIERLLGLSEGEASATLRGMHSVLEVSGPKTDICILHESFSDFLHSRTRSGPYYIQVIPHIILLSWNCGLRRMVAEPVMFACLWQGFALLVYLTGTWSSFIIVLAPIFQWPFITLAILSSALAGMSILACIVASAKLKMECLHVESDGEVSLVCIPYVGYIIWYLILILAYAYVQS
uniref:Uncharacterized protein n=1 Tax=Moniliophthora roreri TaxID=221103 RepID=A0A0W0FYR7_MONRR